MIMDETELCFGELAYENRLVAFFDILGWKGEIAAAGSDPRRIARLAAAVRMFSANAATVGDAGARLTTFSDNVVFSKPFAEGDVPWLLQGLATTQLGLAVQGFWMRGAVTVGLLHHDEYIVFGPALNRAHHLESRVARYPRILLDQQVLAATAGTDFIEVGEESFIDPFTPRFWDRVQAENPIAQQTLDRFNELSGMKIPAEPARVSGGTALASVANRLSAELTSIEDPAAWEKLAWLFDRVVRSLGGRAVANDLPKSARLKAALGV
ncbi:hypothetical protein [Sphingomonas oligophenolica]|uniref:Guanylate cyclase domain-containing protein n=1 Tax=Sphingomonas oligophenolica TaxID=301154 RepID=A0A502CR51_9SPHN|nr:hypothetical protein [Sphingomonas oligophenolica]TPG15358.1 hypothetical protein EAH84_00670 [Sphingomonas oligophenolica]